MLNRLPQFLINSFLRKHECIWLILPGSAAYCFIYRGFTTECHKKVAPFVLLLLRSHRFNYLGFYTAA